MYVSVWFCFNDFFCHSLFDIIQRGDCLVDLLLCFSIFVIQTLIMNKNWYYENNSSYVHSVSRNIME